MIKNSNVERNLDNCMHQILIKSDCIAKIEVVIEVLNEDVLGIAVSFDAALRWVQDNVLFRVSPVNITVVAVGNEFLNATGFGNNDVTWLISACQNMHSALLHFGLGDQIKVSSPQAMTVLDHIFPPSKGSFSESYLSFIVPYLNFLDFSSSLFILNISAKDHYPCHNKILKDPISGLDYSSIFDASIDTLHTAMASLNYSHVCKTAILISPTNIGSSTELQTGRKDMENSNDNRKPSQARVDGHAKSKVHVPSYHQDERQYMLRNASMSRFIPNLSSQNSDPNFNPSYHQDERQYMLGNASVSGFIPNSSFHKSNSNLSSSYSSKEAIDSSKVETLKLSLAWCVGKAWANPEALQEGLDWACGAGGADCRPIQPNGVCYLPYTVLSHASYAFNSYYQIHQQAEGTCDFAGTATITNEDPSNSHCFFPFCAGEMCTLIAEGSVNRCSSQSTLLIPTYFFYLSLPLINLLQPWMLYFFS